MQSQHRPYVAPFGQQHAPLSFAASSAPRKRHRSTRIHRSTARSTSIDDGDSDLEADRSGTSSSNEDATYSHSRPRKRPHTALDDRAMGQFADMRLDLATGARADTASPAAPPSSPTLARAVAKSKDWMKGEAPPTIISTMDAVPEVDMRVRRPPSSFDIDAHRVCVVSLDDSGTESSSTDYDDTHGLPSPALALDALSNAPDPLRAVDIHINTELMNKLEEEARKRALIDVNAVAGKEPPYSASQARPSRGRGGRGRKSGQGSGASSGTSSPPLGSDEDRRRHALVLWSDPHKVVGPLNGTDTASAPSSVSNDTNMNGQQPFQFGMPAPAPLARQTFGFGPAEGYASEIMRTSTPMTAISSGSASPMQLD